MTTTTFKFTGNENSAVSFTPSLDGAVYNAVIKWNLAAQRWYLTITSNSGARMLTRPLVGSSNTSDINILFGIFTTKLIWREASGLIEVVS